MGVSVVLVTNVGQGFGRAIALAYGQADYDVVCVDKDVTLASKTAAEIEELGGQAIPVQADMSVQIDVRNTFAKVLEIFGELSGVVHVTNFVSHTPFVGLSEGEFNELIEDNLKSTFFVLKSTSRLQEDAWVVIVSPPKAAAEPHMIAVRGAITRMAAGFETQHRNFTVNVAVPSRLASDPKHDAALVDNVLYLGSRTNGLSGQRVYVTLPPPPMVAETLLPEVRAALDATVRQDDLEASLFADEELEDTLDYDDADPASAAANQLSDQAAEVDKLAVDEALRLFNIRTDDKGDAYDVDDDEQDEDESWFRR